MSDLETLYERNAAFAATFDQGELPIKPRLSTLILTCVDARLGPEHIVGLELGDALVLRNVGARVTDTIGLEVAMLFQLMAMASGTTPSMELVIIQHTQCGMARFAVPEVAEQVTAHFGTPDVVATYGISDLEETLDGDVARLRNNRVVPRQLVVSGHIYDVTAGTMREVVPTQRLE